MTDSQLVMVAARRAGVLSIQTGKWHKVCQEMAERHARYMARVRQQGHQLWDQRWNELARTMPECKGFNEVAAQSWPWDTRESAADEMFKSWRQSSGHWASVNGRCDFWGYSMAKGANGLWYGCGVFAHLR